MQPNSPNKTLVIAIKSNDSATLDNAYNFTLASLDNPKIIIKTIFFYQDGAYILLDNTIHNKWQNFLINNKLTASICKSAAKKRGLADNIELPFKPSSLAEFISTIDNAEQFKQF